MKKKKYNPFKMWGSYVGILLFILLLLALGTIDNKVSSCVGDAMTVLGNNFYDDAILQNYISECNNLPNVLYDFFAYPIFKTIHILATPFDAVFNLIISPNCTEFVCTGVIFSEILSNFIVSIILGFLIGWGIHSLFRRLKK